MGTRKVVKYNSSSYVKYCGLYSHHASQTWLISLWAQVALSQNRIQIGAQLQKTNIIFSCCSYGLAAGSQQGGSAGTLVYSSSQHTPTETILLSHTVAMQSAWPSVQFIHIPLITNQSATTICLQFIWQHKMLLVKKKNSYKRPYLSLAVPSPSCHWNPQVWESPSACQSTRVLSLWQPQPVLSCEEINHHKNSPMLTAVYKCIIAQKQYHKQSHNNLFDKQLQHHRKSKNVSQKNIGLLKILIRSRAYKGYGHQFLLQFYQSQPNKCNTLMNK